MCDTCGCTPCKCGRDIKNKVCSGCGKAAKECKCTPVKKSATAQSK